ncbi:MAG: Uma2 family endonuclease [Planctomycetales bacterium]|nr:Uma2 family endonuclease [Planctomycetales bacterium]
MPTKTKPRLTTADELFEQPADGYRYELVAGELRMMSPAGGRHGRIAYRIAQILGNHVDANQLGVVFAAETGFKIEEDPDTVLAPDVAFITQNRYEQIEDDTAYLPIPPDFVGEVTSPSDRFSRVESKAFAWLDAGVKLVLLVDPQTETIHAYRSRNNINVYQSSETIDCSDAVAGWNLDANKVFKS